MSNPFEQIEASLGEIKERLNAIELALPKEQSVRKYSIQELAQQTPIGEQTIYSYIKDGRIKAERLGRKYLIPAEEFDRVCQEARSMRYKRD